MDYETLAKQFGGTTTKPQASGVDYSALAKQFGGQTTPISSPYVEEPKIGVEPTFKASIGGAETIIPNVAKTIGNIPSNAGDILTKTIDATAGNTGRSLQTVQDIYKEQGFKEGTKNIALGFADTGTKIFKAPGQFLVNSDDRANLLKNLKPIQQEALKKRDELLTLIDKNKKSGRDNSRLIQALKQNEENLGSLAEQISTPEERNLKSVNQMTDIVKYPIERPLDIPLALYAGKNKAGSDIISDIAKPITRGVDTGLANIIPKTKEIVNKSLIARQPQAINELEQTYNEIMSGTTPGKKKIAKIETKTEALNRAGTEGKTPMRTLAEDGIIPNQAGTKLDTFEQAENYRQKITPLRDANRQALKETGLSTAPVKLDDLETKAIEYAKTPDNINAGRFDSMQRDIQNEFNLLREHYPSGEIPLNIVDDIKSARWDNVFKNKGLIEADVLKKNSEYAIAKSLQKSIEETATLAGNSEVAQLNRAIGDRLEAAKFLENLNGKTIKGGRLLKYLTTGIGASLGNTFTGKILGALGGNVVGDLILSNTIASPIKRLILKNLQTTNPKAYTKTLEWLSKQNLDRETRLLLSAPKPTSIPLGGQTFIGGEVDASGKFIIPKQEKASIIPALKNPVSVNPKSGKFQTTYSSSQSKSPINQQTTPAITRTSIIPKTLPKAKPKVNNKATKKKVPLLPKIKGK